MEKQKNTLPTISGEAAESNLNRPVRDVPVGILRLDLGKPRRLSAEFKFSQKEIISPQPSIPSVTFAEESLKSDTSKCNLNLGPSRMQQLQQQQSLLYQQDKAQFPEESLDGNESDEEDYSASVNAIIQRRASTRRSKKQSRRASSPFTPETPGPERRRSSVFTTSSGDTAITVDDNLMNDVTQDEIFENIKLHKEVLSNVKMQPWNMRKKLKLVLQAKAYIKKHEGQLQERLAQSHSTKDMLARWNIVLIKKWQKWHRELTNMLLWFIPWELKIKEIESHFGSVVASYFIFLRWLFWVNIVIAVVIISFVTIPEIITADPEAVKDRKFVLPEERYNSTNFLTLWDFEGVFKYSPLFYGWYTNRDYNDSAVLNSYDRKKSAGHGYRLPFAYFVTGLVVYAYSFFATLRKMAENSRMSKLSEKDDECIFSWKVFTAWDYMIGNAETAHNRVASIVMGFKEALLEEAEKKRESRNWKIICIRVLVNTLVAGLLSCSVVAVVIVVRRSTEPEANSTVWRRNEITVVITLITLFFPMLFEVLGFVEQYHPRKQLRLQLARIMVLNLLNLYSLIFALFDKITDMTILLQEFKTNLSKGPQPDTLLSTTPLTFNITTQSYDDSTVRCFCNDMLISNQNAVISLDMISHIAENLSAIALPKLKELADIFYNKNISESFVLNDILTSSQETYLNITETFLNSANFSFSETTTSIPDNFTYYYENSSVYWEENTTDYLNYGIFNQSDNLTELTFNDTLSIEDLKDIFVDYLTFILSPFIYVNTTDFQHIITTNLSFNTSYEIENMTAAPLNFSTMDYKYFKSTVLPLFNNTLPQAEQRFETELSSVFEEISTTIASWPEIVSTGISIYTSAEYEETTNTAEDLYCSDYCKSLLTSRSTSAMPNNVTSTALATLSYGEVEYRKTLNYTMNAKLRSLCWETMFGQELLKLTILDLIMNGLSILFMDFIRGIFVRFMNRCWCWDLEKKFPQYGDFKVAENILHLVNNQGMVWMGMFFSPGLVVLNVVKLYIMMYLRAWAVLTCNVPHEIIFRASRSNNFYYALLLMMLFLCVLPVGYAIVWIEPSWHCGPFSGYQRIFHIFTKTIRANVPESMHRALDYIASPGIVIPLLLLLVLIIYYLVSLTGALREANNDLKTQLRRERTEERRKMFQLADRRRRGGSGESNDQTPFSKWKKLMGNLPSTRSCDEPRQESEDIAPSQKEEEEEGKVENKGRVFFTKLIKKALGKSSTSDEEQDGTDTDQHDSLPYDNHKDVDKEQKSIKTVQSSGSLELNTLQSIVSRIRRNSHREEKNSDQKSTVKKNENIENTAVEKDKKLKITQDSEKETNNSKKKVERTKNIMSETVTKDLTGKQDSDRRKFDTSKQINVSDVDIHTSHLPKFLPSSKRHQEHDIAGDALKDMSPKPKQSTAFKNEHEKVGLSKYSKDKQKHPGISKLDEGNIFLKTIIEAKRAGVFNNDENIDEEKETKASTSYENKHKKVREKDYSKVVKNKTKKPILELDEESVENEEQNNAFLYGKTNTSTVVTADTHFEYSKKPAVGQDSSSSVWSDNIPVITISKIYSDDNIMGKEETAILSKRGNTTLCQKPKSKEDCSQTVGVRRKFIFKDDTDDYDDDDFDDEDDSDHRDKTELKKLHHGAKNKPNKNQELQSAKQESSFRPRIRCVLKKQVTAIDEDVIIHFGEHLEKVEAEKQIIDSLKNQEIDEERTAFLPVLDSSSGIRFNTEDIFLTPKLEASSSRSEEGVASDKSTSDDTELREDHSIDTVLHSPYYISEDNESLGLDNAIKPSDGDDSVDNQTDLELETDANDSIEYETEFTSEDTEEYLNVDRDENDEINVMRLQRPSIRSSSRSQTESSSYYNE